MCSSSWRPSSHAVGGGGDWNLTPESLRASGWLDLVDGSVVAAPADTGTCRSTSGHFSNIDFFVVQRTAAPAFAYRGVVRDSSVRTHRPMQIVLSARPRSYVSTRLKRIRQFPLCPPALPARAPHAWPAREAPRVSGAAEDATQTAVNDLTAFALDNLESELVCLYDVGSREAPLHRGRGGAAKPAPAPCLGSRAHGVHLCLGPAGLWWQSITHCLDQILRLAAARPAAVAAACATRALHLAGARRHLLAIVSMGSMRGSSRRPRPRQVEALHCQP